MEIEQELTFSDYLSAFKRRWRQIVVAFILSIIAIIIIAFVLPEVYESEGTIAVESPSISKELLEQTNYSNYVDERIDKVTEKVLSKESLVRLNQKYSLFPGLTDPNDVEEAMHKAITVTKAQKKKSGNEWSNEQVTVALVVNFKYSTPEMAYKVANRLVAQYLDENVKARKKRVTETTGFLTDELDRMKVDLEKVENKVADYKQKYANSLPEHQELHMGSLDRLSADIKILDRDYKDTQEELRYLDVELTTTRAALKNTGSDGKVITISELDKAKAELDRSLILYKETHPTVRALKRKVSVLEQEKQLPEQSKPVKTNVVAELAIAKIKTQIEAARVRLNSISAQKQSMHSKMNRLQSQIVKIPQVERGLFTLLRDYENAKKKYEDVKAKQINAQIAENLESKNKAERFILTKKPEIPKYRTSPHRTKIFGLGLFGALGLGLAFAMLMEMLDKRIRGQAAISSIINMRPLAIIPYVKTPAELSKEKKIIKFAWTLGVILLSLLTLAVCVHFFVTPINTLISEFV
jgi:polysaccharide chain length determinant protein (PEP-CTERM system associated)